MASLMLTNKSTRVYTTSIGQFHPGTSREFEEKEAIQLLGYSGEIVKTKDMIGTDAKSMIDAKDKEIASLKAQIVELNKKLAKPSIKAV